MGRAKVWAVAYWTDKTRKTRGWCATKGNRKLDPDEKRDPTACGYFVTMRGAGMRRDVADITCEACKKIVARRASQRTDVSRLPIFKRRCPSNKNGKCSGGYHPGDRAAKVCPSWRCSRCRKSRPWCDGAADEFPGQCSACWLKSMRERERKEQQKAKATTTCTKRTTKPSSKGSPTKRAKKPKPSATCSK